MNFAVEFEPQKSPEGHGRYFLWLKI